MGEIKVKENWHPNTSLEFSNTGMWIRVSLNIENDLAKFLSQNNVTKGKYRTVYALRSFIESGMVCKDTLETIHSHLLNNCMKNIRIAKEKRKQYLLTNTNLK